MFARIRSRSARRDEQAGFTLVEILVTVAIMGIAFVVIIGAIGVFFSSTRVQRGSADLDAAMRTYVEKLQSKDTPYVDCATTSSYSIPVASGLTASISSVGYWDGNPAPAGYAPTCPPHDNGQQQLTVSLKRTSDGQVDSLVIVKRNEVQP